jgi:hypothetical protein
LLGFGAKSMTLLLTTSRQQVTIKIHLFSRIKNIDSKKGVGAILAASLMGAVESVLAKVEMRLSGYLGRYIWEYQNARLNGTRENKNSR